MRKKIAVFTGTRAEYGLLYWLLKEIEASDLLDLQLIVGGMHLSHEFGETWKEIAADGFRIDAKIEMLLSSNTDVGVVKSVGLGAIGLADALDRLRPDLLILLGDRFEALAAAHAAAVMQIPVAHLHGGECTEGAYDDAVRHAITKLSSLHFVAAEAPFGESSRWARRRTVFSTWVPSDSTTSSGPRGFRSRTSRPRSASPCDRRTWWSPITPPRSATRIRGRRCSEICSALDEFPTLQVLVTYPNADNGGRDIIPVIEDYARRQPDRVVLRRSLGSRVYTSAVAGASAVVGNSSSGLIEAPAFGVPTVDVGIRQRGRLSAQSVVHCDPDAASIAAALRDVLSDAFRARVEGAVNPYGQGDSAGAIARHLERLDASPRKRFFDVHW